jgi:hypothetical protein
MFVCIYLLYYTVTNSKLIKTTVQHKVKWRTNIEGRGDEAAPFDMDA